MRQRIRLNLRLYGTGYKSANFACGSLHSSRVHRAVPHPDVISLPTNKYKLDRDNCRVTHANRLTTQSYYRRGKISFSFQVKNGQVSRLDRPNEWVKFKKFQQKFGEFERAQVRGFLSLCNWSSLTCDIPSLSILRPVLANNM